MTKAEKIAKLQKCIELLEEVDALQQEVNGVESWTTHNNIYGVIEALDADIEELNETL